MKWEKPWLNLYQVVHAAVQGTLKGGKVKTVVELMVAAVQYLLKGLKFPYISSLIHFIFVSVAWSISSLTLFVFVSVA